MSSHEAAARTAKVVKILDAVPAGKTAAEVAGTAEWLAGLTVAERNALAAAVVVNAPSDETWALVVATQRKRAPETANPFARVREDRT